MKSAEIEAVPCTEGRHEQVAVSDEAAFDLQFLITRPLRRKVTAPATFVLATMLIVEPRCKVVFPPLMVRVMVATFGSVLTVSVYGSDVPFP